VKKILTKTVCAFLLAGMLATPAMADWMNLTTGSGQVQVCSITAPATASGVAVSGAVAFFGVIVKTDGVNDVTINIYNGANAAGDKIIPTDMVIAGRERTWALSYVPAVKCVGGIYVTISVAGGGTATYQILYDK